jgi:hypothetical protein
LLVSAVVPAGADFLQGCRNGGEYRMDCGAMVHSVGQEYTAGDE